MKSFKVLAVGITFAIMLGVGAWTFAYVVNSQRVNDLAGVVSDIQTSRLANCQDVTQRNANTLRLMFKLIEKRKKGLTKTQREVIDAQTEQTVAFIDAMLPPRDEKACRALISKKPPPTKAHP